MEKDYLKEIRWRNNVFIYKDKSKVITNILAANWRKQKKTTTTISDGEFNRAEGLSVKPASACNIRVGLGGQTDTYNVFRCRILCVFNMRLGWHQTRTTQTEWMNIDNWTAASIEKHDENRRKNKGLEIFHKHLIL